MGRATIDATAAPGEGATVRCYSLIGRTTVRVAGGARVRLVGGSLIGRRQMDAATGAGPNITVLVCTLIGSVNVVHAV